MVRLENQPWKMGRNEEGLIAAMTPSQIISQNQSYEQTLLPLNWIDMWPHGLYFHHHGSKTWMPLALCCTAALRNTTPQSLSPLLAATVHCPRSAFLWVTSTRFKVEIRETGNKHFCLCLSPLPTRFTNRWILNYRKGSNVGQPRKGTK